MEPNTTVIPSPNGAQDNCTLPQWRPIQLYGPPMAPMTILIINKKITNKHCQTGTLSGQTTLTVSIKFNTLFREWNIQSICL